MHEEFVIIQSLVILLTYWVNGLLAGLYWLADHWAAWLSLAIAVFSAVTIDGRDLAQAQANPTRYGRARNTPLRPRDVIVHPATLLIGLLWLVAAWITPSPVPTIGLAMWAGSLTPLWLPLGKRRALHKLRWWIGTYALLVLGFWALARFPLSPAQASAWSERLQAVGAGEALEFAIRAQFIPYVALIIWGVYPLTYFGYLAQQLSIHRTFLRDPRLSLVDRSRQLRTRGEA